MTEKKQSSSRRVSFAVEPQINYIYHEECNTTKTSSSINDIPMDITTDLLEFKNLNLFNAPEESNLKKNVENLFTEEDYSSADPTLMEPGSFLSKRCSLDPLRATAKSDTSSRLNKDPQRLEPSFEDPKDISSEVLTQFKGGAEKNAAEGSQLQEVVKENKAGQSKNIFWRTSISNEPRISLENGLNDTGIMNSSFAVEELVNTIDLRKIIPQEHKESKSVNEFLSSQGIRFLDEAVIDGMKRDTLSKSRNIVDPAMENYYKFSLRERIDFLYGFSGYLIDKMKDLQRDIDEVQGKIDVDCLNKENLKRIRNESRNKSKIDWYGLRKIYEIQFNKRIMENKSKVLELLDNNKKENSRIRDLISQKSKAVEELKGKIASLKERVMQNDENKIQETEKLQSMIRDRKKVLEATRSEYDNMSLAYEAQKKEEVLIEKRLEKLKLETESLKKNLAIKNINEHQLEEIKRQIQRYRTAFNLKVLKLAKHEAIFDLYGSQLHVEMSSSCDVSKFSVVLKEVDPFYEIAKPNSEFKGKKLSELVRGTLARFALASSIKKEVSILKEKIKVESFCHNNVLYLRLHLDMGRNVLDLSVNNSFDLLLEEKVVGNLCKELGMLTYYVNGRINK